MVADRLVERQRLAGHLDDAAGVVERHAGPLGDFFRIRLAAELLDEVGGHRPDRPIVSIMCTGRRIVRLWSAIARVMAWRIHHVA